MGEGIWGLVHWFNLALVTMDDWVVQIKESDFMVCKLTLLGVIQFYNLTKI